MTARRVAACLAALVVSVAAQGQVRSLADVNARRSSDFGPKLEGETVVVRGTVASHPVAHVFHSHLAIQDQQGHGLILEAALARFASLQPGNQVEVRGLVSNRAGLVVVQPAQIQVLARGPAPSPQALNPAAVQSLENVGRLVVTEGRVLRRGENTAGELLLIGDANKPLRILLPRVPARGRVSGLERFETGDKVRVTGAVSQQCPFPPYDRYFQIAISDADSVVLLRKRWLISPESFVVALAALAFALGVWWMRERRMAAQRNLVRTFYGLGEQVIAAASPQEIADKLGAVLPGMLKTSGVNVYLNNRASKSLERVATSGDPESFAVAVHFPEGSLPVGAAACFRNQALLTITDTRRSPFFPDGRRSAQPRSVMFVPMFAESELLGVLEVNDSKPMRVFSPEEKLLTQHLANQAGIAMRLMEEKQIREQLFRSEKLAAVGQLISGVATELRSPLESISKLTDTVVNSPSAAMWEDLRTISEEARKASDIVSRLVSFLQPERVEARRIELNSLLRSLIEFRRAEWEARGFLVRELLCPTQVYVLGSQGQLERVFLDLLVQAEQTTAEAPKKTLTISTSVLARRVLVEISYAVNPVKSPRAAESPREIAMPGEGVSRGIVRSHGGEVRLVRSDDECRLEVDLPVAPARLAAEGAAARAFTCLVVEPEAEASQVLVNMLTNRGCRVIPAGSAEAGYELVQRLRFDLVFCSIRLPGLNWIGFSETVKPQIGAFVLLTEGYDFELSRGLLSADTHVVSKPFNEAEIDAVLAALEARMASAESPSPRFQLIRSSDRAKKVAN